MNFKTLPEWLDWIKSLHFTQIDLSLDRVKKVAKKLNLLNPSFTTITVAGTNGKGSTVTGLETIYCQAGYKVGTFTSPYLYRFNEQIKILGKEVSDEEIIAAFSKIEEARGDITLTPFEFNTLAALDIFNNAKLDICILEVGLGGRLDAVNIINTDVAIVTTIAIDHAELLGNTRDQIAIEKAGIFRAEKPAVCGDFNPPQTLIDHAKKLSAPLYLQNNEFGFEIDGFRWNWWCETSRLENLPIGQLALQNMSVVLMTVELLKNKFPVKKETIESALTSMTLSGRIQVIEGEVKKIFDVSHNPAAVGFLSGYLESHKIPGKTLAVFSMLADKDIIGTIATIKDHISEWYVAPLIGDRAASLSVLQYCFRKLEIENVNFFESIEKAFENAETAATKNDEIIIFGSFHTVAEVSKKPSSPTLLSS